MNPIKQFYDNEPMRESVKAFMIEVLGDMVISTAFEGGDTDGFKHARSCVENTFDKLEELYGEKKQPVITNSK